MTMHSTAQQKYLEAAQLFHWATKEHYAIWFTGSAERHRRTETVLSRLAKKWADPATRGRSLFATRYGKRLIYTCPRRVRNPDILHKIDHGLGCTETLVRFWRSDMTAAVIEERFFHKCGSIPDLGLKYPNGKMILVEFSSNSNFQHYNVIKNKLSAYKHYLWSINEKFTASSILIFVIDVPREKVQKFVWETMPVGLPVFFTDFETFKSVPIGNQLSAPIYIWGEDGKTYPLTEDAKL